MIAKVETTNIQAFFNKVKVNWTKILMEVIVRQVKEVYTYRGYVLMPYVLHIYHPKDKDCLIEAKKKTYKVKQDKWNYGMIDEPPIAMETTKGRQNYKGFKTRLEKVLESRASGRMKMRIRGTNPRFVQGGGRGRNTTPCETKDK